MEQGPRSPRTGACNARHGRLWLALLLPLAFRHPRHLPGGPTYYYGCSGFLVVGVVAPRREKRGGSRSAASDPTPTASSRIQARRRRPRSSLSSSSPFLGGSSTHPFRRSRTPAFATVGDETSTDSSTHTDSPAPSSRRNEEARQSADAGGDVQRLLELMAASSEGEPVREGGPTHGFGYATYHDALEHCHETTSPALALKVLEAMKRHATAKPTDGDYGLVVRTICVSSDGTYLSKAIELAESSVANVSFDDCTALLRALRNDWKGAVRVLRAVERRAEADAEPPAALVSAYRLAIEACAMAGQAEPARQILQSALERGGAPAAGAPYGLVISTFARRQQWRRALQLLDHMMERGLDPSLSTYNSILAAMSKAREAGPALALLGRLRQQQSWSSSTTTIRPDVYSYNSALSAAASDARYWREALQVFDQCQREPGVKPDVYTYSNAIRACAKGGQTQRALALLRAAKDLRLPVDGYCYTAAMEACSKAKMYGAALDLLKEMQVEYKLKPNAVAFSLCISACGNAGRWQTALDLLQQMRNEGLRINLITYNSAITALSKSAGRHRHQSPVKPMWPVVQTLLSQMRQDGLEPDGFSYSSAIACCGAEGRWKEALQLIEEMKSNGTRPNRVAFSAAISTCGRNGQVEHAGRLFREMREQGVAPDRVAYNAMFSALRVAKRGDGAYELWREMLSGNGRDTSSNATSAIVRGAIATPDIITVTEVIASLASDESPVSKDRADEVFCEAFDRNLVLRSNLDSTWDFDLSGMSLPVARAACRFILNRIAKSSDSPDVHDLTLVTGVGINHARRSAGDQDNDEGAESRNISLRAYIQEILVKDFSPPLTSIIPARAQGTLVVTAPVLLKWLASAK